MAVTFEFLPAAETEYLDAVSSYVSASGAVELGIRSVDAVEEAVRTIVAAPGLWRVAGEPKIRRYALRKFPYVIYYRFHEREQRVTIHAVMHTSRKPGAWRGRREEYDHCPIHNLNASFIHVGWARAVAMWVPKVHGAAALLLRLTD